MTTVLITGMSGTGKSAVIADLASRGYRAIDTDSDDWSHWQTDETGHPDWIWREDRIRDLLASANDRPLFISGCKSNQGSFYPLLDHVVLLSAPIHIVLDRIEYRTGNDYGKDLFERHLILQHIKTIEPLLRQSADLEIDTSMNEVTEVADRLIGLVTR